MTGLPFLGNPPLGGGRNRTLPPIENRIDRVGCRGLRPGTFPHHRTRRRSGQFPIFDILRNLGPGRPLSSGRLPAERRNRAPIGTGLPPQLPLLPPHPPLASRIGPARCRFRTARADPPCPWAHLGTAPAWERGWHPRIPVPDAFSQRGSVDSWMPFPGLVLPRCPSIDVVSRGQGQHASPRPRGSSQASTPARPLR
jgi:hypothetical protein